MNLVAIALLGVALFIYFLAIFVVSTSLFFPCYIVPCFLVDVLAFVYMRTKRGKISAVLKASLATLIVLSVFSTLFCGVYSFLKGYGAEIFLSALAFPLFLNVVNSCCFGFLSFLLLFFCRRRFQENDDESDDDRR